MASCAVGKVSFGMLSRQGRKGPYPYLPSKPMYWRLGGIHARSLEAEGIFLVNKLWVLTFFGGMARCHEWSRHEMSKTAMIAHDISRLVWAFFFDQETIYRYWSLLVTLQVYPSIGTPFWPLPKLQILGFLWNSMPILRALWLQGPWMSLRSHPQQSMTLECCVLDCSFCAVWSVSGSIQNGIDLSATACEACSFKIPKFNLILLKNSTEEWQEIAGVGGNVLLLSQWPSPICGSWFYAHEVTFTCLRLGIWYCNV